jgi:hypothetical protein
MSESRCRARRRMTLPAALSVAAAGFLMRSTPSLAHHAFAADFSVDQPNEWAFAATVSKHPGKERILEPKVHECVENNDGFALGSTADR